MMGELDGDLRAQAANVKHCWTQGTGVDIPRPDN